MKHLQVYVSGYKQSTYKIEWIRYETDARYPEIVKSVPHVPLRSTILSKNSRARM